MNQSAKLMGIMLIAVLLMSACGETNDQSNVSDTEGEKTEQNQEEKKEEQQPELGAINNLGKVKTVKEFGTYKTENEHVGYELTNVKIVELSDYTSDGELALAFAGEDAENLPDSMYVLIGTETITNKKEMPIEFTGVTTGVIGNKQVDMVMNDFVSGENENENGSNMMGGVTVENEFGVKIPEAEVDKLTFTLSSAFDSETFMEEYLKEQQIEVPAK